MKIYNLIGVSIDVSQPVFNILFSTTDEKKARKEFKKVKKQLIKEYGAISDDDDEVYDEDKWGENGAYNYTEEEDSIFIYQSEYPLMQNFSLELIESEITE